MNNSLLAGLAATIGERGRKLSGGEILVLTPGSSVEVGKHDELVCAGGKYAQLHKQIKQENDSNKSKPRMRSNTSETKTKKATPNQSDKKVATLKTERERL